MTIKLRNYIGKAGITEDYYKIREFLLNLGYSEYTYARWDWMISHSYLEKEAINKIGIWEDEGNIVGLATYDCQLGEAFCLTNAQYTYLKKDILKYAKDHLNKDDEFVVMIRDDDKDFQDIAIQAGFVATERKESDAVFYVNQDSTEYSLPEGFTITSMKENLDLRKYANVLWKGFNHELDGEGELKFTEEDERRFRESMIRPNVDLSMKFATVNSDGDYVSYCGMWYDPVSEYAIIEPVATDPDYRKMGLGKAAVLEGIKRVGELGAKKVLVGSTQQFYYSIGLRPYATTTAWKER